MLGGMTPLRAQLLEVVKAKGLREADQPFKLSSGEMSNHFIDAKRALAEGSDLRLACEAMAEVAAERGVDYDAVGGLTMGADQFAHGLALVAGKRWFVVRKEPKGRGTNQSVEGAVLGPDDRVLLVDDIVTTGGSIQKAYGRVRDETGAQVVLAMTVVDRGEVARAFFEAEGVAYEPLFTYVDLGIPPVGGRAGGEAAAGF